MTSASSSSLAGRATTSTVVPRYDTVARGWASRLSTHAGVSRPPKLLPMRARVLP